MRTGDLWSNAAHAGDTGENTLVGWVERQRALFASNQSERNPTEFCWRFRAEFWVKLLGFAPASLHPTYDCMRTGDLWSNAAHAGDTGENTLVGWVERQRAFICR